MTAFTFNVGVPATNNNPSVDQPDMLINNVSNNAIWAVDHVTFNTAGSGGAGASGGQHLQVTFNAKATPGAMVDPLAIVYTFDGVANTVHPQLYFKNSQGIFPLSSIRAFGSFLTVGGTTAPTLINSFNIVSGTQPSHGSYEFILETNATNGNNVLVFPFINTSNNITYTYVNPTLTITTSSVIGSGNIINFIVIQI